MRSVWAAVAAAVLALAPLAAFSAPSPGRVLTGVSAFPNPFDSRRRPATLRWTLAEDAAVDVSVFTVFGSRVWGASAAAGQPGGRAGANETPWNGSDERGRPLAKGMYLLVVRAGGERSVVRVGVVH